MRGGEGRPLGIPHPAIGDAGVDEHERLAGPRDFVREPARRSGRDAPNRTSRQYARQPSRPYPCAGASAMTGDADLQALALPGRSPVGTMRANGRPAGRTFFETAPDLVFKPSADAEQISMLEEDTCATVPLA